MKALAHFALLFALLPGLAHSTAQIPDRLLIDGEMRSLFVEPLTRYLIESGKYAKLKPYIGTSRCTASWRGFVAEWRVHESRLELVKILADPCGEDRKEVPLSEIFPEQQAPILATWFTGRLLVPLGKRTQYVHMGYESKYERYLTLTIEGGKVLGREESEERPK